MIVQLDEGLGVALAVGLDFVDGQAPGERAEDLLEAVSLFDRFRVRGDDDVTQLVNPGVGRKRKPHVAVDAKVAEFLPPRLRVVNLDELQIGAVLPGGRMVHDLGDDQRRAAARRRCPRGEP